MKDKRLKFAVEKGSISLPEELKKELELKDGETFEVVIPADSYVVLKRENKQEEGRVAFVGELGGLTISDLFSVLNLTQKTGMLQIVSSGVKKSIYFRKGEIVFASSNVPEERLGYFLYRTGKITMEQLKKAEAEVGSKTRFGGVLLKKKFITPKDLWWGIKYQLEEIIYSVFSFNSGTFIFLEGDFLPPDLTRLSLNTQNLLMEGYRRMDEWSVIKELIPSSDVCIAMSDEPITVELTPTFQKILACIEGKATVDDIIKKAQLGEFNTYKILYQLIRAKVLKIAEKEARPEVDIGIKRLHAAIEKYNSLYAYIVGRVKKSVPDFKVSDSLSVFFDELSDKLKKVFSQVKIDGDGKLDVEHVIRNINKINLIESQNFGRIAGFSELMHTQFLLEGLNELLNFYIFSARNIISENEGEELVREVRQMQQVWEKK